MGMTGAILATLYSTFKSASWWLYKNTQVRLCMNQVSIIIVKLFVSCNKLCANSGSWLVSANVRGLSTEIRHPDWLQRMWRVGVRQYGILIGYRECMWGVRVQQYGILIGYREWEGLEYGNTASCLVTENVRGGSTASWHPHWLERIWGVAKNFKSLKLIYRIPYVRNKIPGVHEVTGWSSYRQGFCFLKVFRGVKKFVLGKVCTVQSVLVRIQIWLKCNVFLQ